MNLFESNYYDEKYDYYSIMHYDRKSFSKNGRDTMVARQPGMSRVIGRVKDFSNIDLHKINKMYSCPTKSFVVTQSPLPPVVWQPWQPAQPVVQPQLPAVQPAHSKSISFCILSSCWFNLICFRMQR